MTGMVGRLMGGFGGGGGGPAADLWEKTLWPNFPGTVLATGLRTGVNVTTLNMPANATITDVTGPNGELGVQVSVINSSARMSFPTFSAIDLTQGNIEIDFSVSIKGGLSNGTDLTIAVSSGGADPLNTSNTRSVSIASKLEKHYAGVNKYTLIVPNNRIATVNGTGATMTAITGIRISTNNTSGVDPVFQVYEVRYRQNDRISSPAFIVFRFDGASSGQYNVALPKLKAAFGNTTCKGMFQFGKRFLNSGGFFTTAQLLDVLAAGAVIKPHGGIDDDLQRSSTQDYIAQFGPHRVWFKDFGNANGYPAVDHWSSFFGWYNNTNPTDLYCYQALLQSRAASYGMQFNSASGAGSNVMPLGGAAWPPSRWNMECASANSWDAANGFANDSDAVAGAQSVMDNALANRSYACFGWHAITAGDRSDIVLDTVIAKIAAEPTNFVPLFMHEPLDAALALYGGIP